MIKIRDIEALSVKTGIGYSKLSHRIRNQGKSIADAVAMGDLTPVNHDFQIMGMKYKSLKLVNG